MIAFLQTRSQRNRPQYRYGACETVGAGSTIAFIKRSKPLPILAIPGTAERLCITRTSSSNTSCTSPGIRNRRRACTHFMPDSIGQARMRTSHLYGQTMEAVGSTSTSFVSSPAYRRNYMYMKHAQECAKLIVLTSATTPSLVDNSGDADVVATPYHRVEPAQHC